MLVLTFKVGERLAIFDGDERVGTIQILDRRNSQVKLGFEAVERLGFWREALLTSKEDDHAEGDQVEQG